MPAKLEEPADEEVQAMFTLHAPPVRCLLLLAMLLTACSTERREAQAAGSDQALGPQIRIAMEPNPGMEEMALRGTFDRPQAPAIVRPNYPAPPRGTPLAEADLEEFVLPSYLPEGFSRSNAFLIEAAPANDVARRAAFLPRMLSYYSKAGAALIIRLSPPISSQEIVQYGKEDFVEPVTLANGQEAHLIRGTWRAMVTEPEGERLATIEWHEHGVKRLVFLHEEKFASIEVRPAAALPDEELVRVASSLPLSTGN